jgi:putative ABC transport system permease protein
MSRRTLLLRLLFKAAWVRKDRALTALISVGVVATIATAALTVYSNLEGTLGREFRSFGANVVVKPRSASLTAEQLRRLQEQASAGSRSVPVAYVIATGPGDTRVVVGGTELRNFREMNSWWSMRQDAGMTGTALLGSKAAQQLAPTGGAFELTLGDKHIQLSPAAVFTSGSEDDSRIYLDAGDFQKLTGAGWQMWLMQVEGGPREIHEAVSKMRSAVPEAEVEPVRRITQTQTAVVGKTRAVVLASSIIVVILIMLSMAATFTSSVLERRKDFAVMKALGASNRTVNFMFAAEAAFLAIAGSAAGFLLGSGIAFWIGKVNFDAAILPQPALLLPVLLASVALALVASTAPLRLLQRIQPAGILRGE